ncbi:MAG: cohesin domain-containing protein [Ruminiclostridium sp.]
MKYRLNKLLALFIALCLSSCLFSVSISASSDNGITASSANLAPGSVFSISVVIPEAADASNASIQVNFDSTAFEVVSWKPEIPNGVYNSGSDFFTVAAASSSRAIKLDDGLILKAEMRVKDTAEKGLYKFSLTKGSVSFYDENIEDYVELWEPESITITVSVDPENEVITEPEDEGEEIIEIDVDDDDDDDGGDAEITDEGETGDDEGDAEIIEIGDDDDDSGDIITIGDEEEPAKPGNTTPANGNKSPSTGVHIAILIPAAVTGCVILAKKAPRKRFRPKSRKKSRKKNEITSEASQDITETITDTAEE